MHGPPDDIPFQAERVGLDGYTLGVDGGQVGVFEETDEASFGCFWEEDGSEYG